MRRIVFPFLIVIFTLLFTLSAFALIKEERAWKEDILTLLSLVKRVGDYSEMVDLIEVAPALKKDSEIRKAFITFAPPGATPPGWAKEEKKAPPVRVEVPEKIATAEAQKEQRRREKTATAEAQKEKEKRKMKEEEARRIALEVAAQREAAPPEIIKEEPKVEEIEMVTEGPPEKIAIAEITEKVSRWESEQVSREEERMRETEKRKKEKEKREIEEGIKEELGVRPTPLPKGAKVIRSTDVVSGVRAEMVEGKMKVTVTLSGERKYTVSERGRPPAIIIDIPHTINAVFPRRIMVNQGGVRMVEVTQHRATPFDETRVIIRLSRFKEYEVRNEGNEIYVEFEE